MRFLNFYLVLAFFLITSFALGQNRTQFSNLELQPDGKYYRINTIPPFTGIAYDIHPPRTEKEKEKAKLDYEAFLRSAQKREEVSFKNGLPDGKAIGWDEFGQKTYEASFVAGVQQGIERQWYPTGKKKAEVYYLDGEVNGLVVQWYDNGKKQFEGQFEMGKETGLHAWWFKTGTKDQEVDYIDGKIHGYVRNWHENGEKSLESEFKDHLANGRSTEWYDNGQKKGEGIYVNGKESGTFHAWSRKGKLLDEKVYENGELKIERDFRNAGIRTKDGFMQVFNEENAFYSVEIAGQNVKAINTGNIGFIVDKKILQLLNVPVNPNEKSLPSDEVLRNAMKSEVTNIIKDLKSPIETETSLGETDEGIPYIYWKFAHPRASVDPSWRGVLEEHFITLLIKDEILHISSAVTNTDRSHEIKSLLQSVASTVSIKESRIDLNEIRRGVTGG